MSRLLLVHNNLHLKVLNRMLRWFPESVAATVDRSSKIHILLFEVGLMENNHRKVSWLWHYKYKRYVLGIPRYLFEYLWHGKDSRNWLSIVNSDHFLHRLLLHRSLVSSLRITLAMEHSSAINPCPWMNLSVGKLQTTELQCTRKEKWYKMRAYNLFLFFIHAISICTISWKYVQQYVKTMKMCSTFLVIGLVAKDTFRF